MREKDDFKSVRQQFVVNIRKDKREEIINKRRNLQGGSGFDNAQMEIENNVKPVIIVDPRYHDQIQKFVNEEYDESMFDELAAGLTSQDILIKHRCVIGIRKLLAKNVEPPINRFVNKGLINIFMWFVKDKEYPQLKLEAAWTLTNVASGLPEFCQKIVQKGGIDLFIKLLNENEKGIVEQAIWGIGNLAADHTKYRDQIIQKGGLQALIRIINQSTSRSLICNSTWALTNLCRGQPSPKYQLIKQSVPVLCKVLKSGIMAENKQMLSDVVWAVCYMTQGCKSRIQKVNQADVLGQIFKFALDPYKELYIPSLKIIGNFSNGNQNHTEQLIKHGIFDLAMKLLDHPKKPMRRETCWILSNIAAGTSPQVQKFLANGPLLDKLGVIFHTDLVDVKREVCWIYANFGHLGDRKKVVEICLHYDVMTIFSNLLNETETETLQNVLETLYKLLLIAKKASEHFDNKNLLLLKLIEHDGVQRLEYLQQNPSKKVYAGTIQILTKFFEIEQQTI